MGTGIRLLELLGLLQAHRSWSGEELARRLEVSPRTLRRDVEQLRILGYPVETRRGIGGGYRLAPGGSLPPLVVDDEEAVAMVLGLQAAARSGVAGVESASVRALAKLVQVLPIRLRRQADSLRGMAVSPAAPRPEVPLVDVGVLTTIALSSRDSERLSFSYRNRAGEIKVRTVEPHRLVPYQQRWYLVAYDLDSHDWRTFRLDRIEDVEQTRTRFRPRKPPIDDAVQIVREGMASQPSRYAVSVVIHAPAPRVRQEVADWGRVEELGEATSRLRMSVETLDWVAMMLGAIGATFVIDEPPELIDYIHDWGERFLQASTSKPGQA